MSKDIFYRILATIFIAILIFALHRFMTVGPRPQQPALANPPLLMAHRGGANLWPENTIFAFERATTLGVDLLELDVRLTADDNLVVIHDDTVDRTTNGHGLVREMTVQQLQELDAAYNFTPDNGTTYPYRGQGIHIPTLEEVLNTFPQQRINIEIKDDDKNAAALLSEIITNYQAQHRVVVVSFHDAPLSYFRTLQPEVATGAGPGETRTFYILNQLYLWRLHRPHADAYQLPTTHGSAHFDTAKFIDHAHQLNQQVHFWTINDPEEMKRLLQLGADGIITDRPDIGLEVFTNMGFSKR